MININMHKDGFIVSGHADYDEYGKDIVCASVSTIVQLAQMGLRVLAKQYPSHIKIIEDSNEIIKMNPPEEPQPYTTIVKGDMINE